MLVGTTSADCQIHDTKRHKLSGAGMSSRAFLCTRVLRHLTRSSLSKSDKAVHASPHSHCRQESSRIGEVKRKKILALVAGLDSILNVDPLPEVSTRSQRIPLHHQTTGFRISPCICQNWTMRIASIRPWLRRMLYRLSSGLRISGIDQ